MKPWNILLAALALGSTATIKQDTVPETNPTQFVSGQVSNTFNNGFELEYFDADGFPARIRFGWDGEIGKKKLCRVEYREGDEGFYAQAVIPYDLPDIKYAVVTDTRLTAPGQARILIVIDGDELHPQSLDLPSMALGTIKPGTWLWLGPARQENKPQIVRVEMDDFEL